MTATLVTATLQRLFSRQGGTPARRPSRVAVQRARFAQAHRLDFADTRPVVFRSEAFAEDIAHIHLTL
jgi:hypothetical protein